VTTIETPDTSDFVLFEVDGATFGIPAASVRFVTRAVAVDPLPKAPGVVVGVVDVRGELAAVVDLRARVRAESPPISPSEYFVVVDVERAIAIRADRAPRLESLDRARFEPVSRLAAGVAEIAGAAKTPDGVVVLLDPHEVVSRIESAEIAALVASREEGG
jgi:purine-binding chemotaxis protein CheW